MTNTKNISRYLSDILKKNMMLVSLAVVVIVFQIWISSLGKNSLLSPANITNLINQNAYVVILAIGMLMCIITGGNIDLSVGSQVALVGAIAGKLIVDGKFNVYISIIICIIAGILIGAWQGFWIAYMRIPAFIVTLAGMLTFRGIMRVILNGLTISPFPQEIVNLFGSYFPTNLLGEEKILAMSLDERLALQLIVSLAVGIALCLTVILIQVFSRISKHKKGYKTEALWSFIVKIIIVCAALMFLFFSVGQDKGVPVILITLGLIALVYTYFTNNTVPGRNMYAMGGNEKAAKLSGVNTNNVLFFSYVNMGFLAAIAALVCVVRFNSIDPLRGQNYEMDAIASCYIGGASAYGGVGTVGGAIIGAIFMGVLNNGMSIVGIDQNWQAAAKGIVLLVAVIIDILSHRGTSKA